MAIHGESMNSSEFREKAQEEIEQRRKKADGKLFRRIITGLILISAAGFYGLARESSHKRAQREQFEQNPVVREYRSATETLDRLEGLNDIISDSGNRLSYNANEMRVPIMKIRTGLYDEREAIDEAIRIAEEDKADMRVKAPAAVDYALTGKIQPLVLNSSIRYGGMVGLISLIPYMFFGLSRNYRRRREELAQLDESPLSVGIDGH